MQQCAETSVNSNGSTFSVSTKIHFPPIFFLHVMESIRVVNHHYYLLISTPFQQGNVYTEILTKKVDRFIHPQDQPTLCLALIVALGFKIKISRGKQVADASG